LNPSPELAQILERFPRGKRENLIPILQEAQEAFGYLSQETMQGIGSWLGLASSKVYGVATFYNQFRFQKQGKVHCQVCRGTACHVKGSAAVLESLCNGARRRGRPDDARRQVLHRSRGLHRRLRPRTGRDDGRRVPRRRHGGIRKIVKQYRKQVEKSNATTNDHGQGAARPCRRCPTKR
jgi:hypothetical protein